jgi:hypothetical protein
MVIIFGSLLPWLTTDVFILGTLFWWGTQTLLMWQDGNLFFWHANMDMMVSAVCPSLASFSVYWVKSISLGSHCPPWVQLNPMLQLGLNYSLQLVNSSWWQYMMRVRHALAIETSLRVGCDLSRPVTVINIRPELSPGTTRKEKLTFPPMGLLSLHLL